MDALTGGHRHVGSVGDEHRAVGQRPAGLGVDQFAKLGQRLGHLVAAFAAANIDDDIGVTPFGQLVLGHGLAGTETAGNGSSAALGDGEHGIHHAHAGDQRTLGRHTGLHGTGTADGPFLAQGQFPLVAILIGDAHNGVVHGVAAVFDHPGHRALHAGSRHALVQDDGGLRAGGVDLAGDDLIPHLHGHGHIPLGIRVKAGDVAAAGNEGAALFFQRRQRPLDTVVDVAQDAGTQSNAQGAAGGGHRLTGRKAARSPRRPEWW